MFQKIKANTGSAVTCLLEVLVGALLLIDPVGFSSAIIITAGVMLMLFGCFCVLRYFHGTPEVAAGNLMLVQGLLGITGGLFCVLRSDWFILTFPVLTILYGIGVMITGFYKVQMAVDMLRLKKGRWGWMAVSAALSLALAAVILWNPFTSTVILWDFIAISLIVEAVFDLVAMILSMRKKKNEV